MRLAHTRNTRAHIGSNMSGRSAVRRLVRPAVNAVVVPALHTTMYVSATSNACIYQSASVDMTDADGSCT